MRDRANEHSCSFCHERPEWFAHSCSFVLSYLRESIWAIWANEWMSDERKSKFPTLLTPDLGTQQFCRDNVIMWSGHKVVCNCHFSLFIVATPSTHWGLTVFRFFSGPWLFSEAILCCPVVPLSHCCVVVVPKLKHCRVPSSGWLCITYNFYVFSQWWNVAKNCDADARVCSLHHTTRTPSNPQLWLGLLPLQIASVYLQSNLPIVPSVSLINGQWKLLFHWVIA